MCACVRERKGERERASDCARVCVDRKHNSILIVTLVLHSSGKRRLAGAEARQFPFPGREKGIDVDQKLFVDRPV